MKKIEWRPVPGYEGLYEVSTAGEVASLRYRGSRKRAVLRPQKGSVNRLQVTLSSGGERKTVAIHTLVLLAFVGPPGEGEECCHGDGDWRNNTLENLRWGSSYENSQDMKRHGKALRDSDNPACRLAPEDVSAIRFLRGIVKGKDLARRYGVSPGHISAIQRGGKRSHLPGVAAVRHGNATMTKSEIQAVREAEGTQQAIADKFGISQSQVSRIKRAKVGVI